MVTRRIRSLTKSSFLGIAIVAGVSVATLGIHSTRTPESAPLPTHPFSIGYRTGTVRSSPVPSLPPNEVDIPTIGVLAPLEPEMINHHTLSIPLDVHTVGLWAQGGQVGGESGTVLLAGHINYYNQGDGALFQLATIRPHARIFLSGPIGVVTVWTVDSLISYPKADLPQSVFAPEGARRLVIVTCGGPFDANTGHYLDNVVVTARPLSAVSGSPSGRAVKEKEIGD
jgi:hypothetical protein